MLKRLRNSKLKMSSGICILPLVLDETLNSRRNDAWGTPFLDHSWVNQRQNNIERDEIQRTEESEVVAIGKRRAERELGWSVMHADKGKVTRLAEQVAGHGKAGRGGNTSCLVELGHVLSMGEYVLKPLQSGGRGAREVSFYEAVATARDTTEKGRQLRRLRRLLPGYFGVVTLTPLATDASGIVGRDYIVLHNLTHGYKRPCVMDVKVGTRTYDDDASEIKRNAEIRKYPPMQSVGFRCLGMLLHSYDKNTHMNAPDSRRSTCTIGEIQQSTPTHLQRSASVGAVSVNSPVSSGNSGRGVWRLRKVGKEWGLSLTAVDAAKGFVAFLHDGEGGLHHEAIADLSSQVGELLTWFQSQRMAQFVSSSVLIVYEAAPAVAGSGVIQRGNAGGKSLSLKLIDFAHTRFMDNAGDDGCIIGLQQMHGCLLELLNVSTHLRAQGGDRQYSVDDICSKLQWFKTHR